MSNSTNGSVAHFIQFSEQIHFTEQEVHLLDLYAIKNITKNCSISRILILEKNELFSCKEEENPTIALFGGISTILAWLLLLIFIKIKQYKGDSCYGCNAQGE
ncbi:MAG: hypothetical protein PHT78_08275 [Desulfitobacteriaceae bacterium]|nr:hypothetical protein [Desulfitobacteriaceae bacterium]MDD4753225.1 hypothetical protein [Desulfitobacteriaceae bacterium]